MRLGGDAAVPNPTLGEAVAHVVAQPREDHWLFDIITDHGMMNYTLIRQLAETPAFTSWAEDQTA